MSGLMDKLKKAAIKAGTAAQKDPRLVKAAQNIVDSVESFKEGYREQREPEKYKVKCPHCQEPLSPKANFCPNCGAKVD